MNFTFEITEIHSARHPITILVGWLREGQIRVYDSISLPLKNGTKGQGLIIALETNRTRMNAVSAGDVDGMVALAVDVKHKAEEIQVGLATFNESERVGKTASGD